jgi:single-strand DNA-binding protein
MSRDLNKVQVIGHLGADPEMRYTAQGDAVTTFSVAAGRQWTDAGGQRRDETEWFKVVAWNKLAEVCNQYLAKGARVYVEGRLQTRRYTDRDGNERTAVEVVAADMIMLDGRRLTPAAITDADAPDGELFADPPPPAPNSATSRNLPSSPASTPARAPAGARPRTSAPNAPRRNVPQPLEEDGDDVPF